MVSYLYHKGTWKKRKPRKLYDLFETTAAVSASGKGIHRSRARKDSR